MKIKKIHVIFGFCYKIKGFRDLSKRLPVALKSLRRNSQHLETSFVPFSNKMGSCKVWEFDTGVCLCMKFDVNYAELLPGGMASIFMVHLIFYASSFYM